MLSQLQPVIIESATRIGTALLLLAVSGVLIGYFSGIVRAGASRKYSEPVIIDLVTDIGKIFMWFWALLMAMSVLGFPQIASSMGTATGFIALGVAFALKDMIADTVAGVYLAQDSDFNSGDHVKIGSDEGAIADVGLRKTRIDTESGDRIVLSNAEVEKKWILME